MSQLFYIAVKHSFLWCTLVKITIHLNKCIAQEPRTLHLVKIQLSCKKIPRKNYNPVYVAITMVNNIGF